MFWPFKKEEVEKVSDGLEEAEQERQQIRQDYKNSLKKLNNLIDDLKDVEQKHHGA